ncbi:hypothetical protein AMTRI_Chr04g250820 [Amborella trichopoda]
MAMFRNKLLLRAVPPFNLRSSLKILQLSVSHPFPFPPSLSTKLESLSWKLSRNLSIACFVQVSNIFIIYRNSQIEAVEIAVKEITETLNVDDVEVKVEEEVESSSLIAKAVECGLKSALLERNWTCLGDNIVVDSKISCIEGETPLPALHLSVQIEADDTLVFLVSPDVLRFSRHKVLNIISTERKYKFESGDEVAIDNSSMTSCSILPSLLGGHVIGAILFISGY